LRNCWNLTIFAIWKVELRKYFKNPKNGMFVFRYSVGSPLSDYEVAMSNYEHSFFYYFYFLSIVSCYFSAPVGVRLCHACVYCWDKYWIMPRRLVRGHCTLSYCLNFTGAGPNIPIFTSKYVVPNIEGQNSNISLRKSCLWLTC